MNLSEKTEKIGLRVTLLALKSDVSGKIFPRSPRLVGNSQATEFYSPRFAPTTIADMEMDDKTFEKKFGKDAALLIHLAKTEGACPFNAAVEGIIKLRQLHVEMDNAVLEAYGWSDVLLRHDFYEVDYLPENDRIRYTIHPDARKEILKRLLELNHKIHAEEVAAGLWDKKAPGKSRKSKKASGNSVNAAGDWNGDLFDGDGGEEVG